jgi:hypothetical protein
MSFGERRPVRRALVSTAWKKTTPKAKARAGHRCEVCGVAETFHLSPKGRTLSNLVVGHRIPPERFSGSHNDLANLWVLCLACNASQGNRTPEEWFSARSGRLVELGLVRSFVPPASQNQSVAAHDSSKPNPYGPRKVARIW